MTEDRPLGDPPIEPTAGRHSSALVVGGGASRALHLDLSLYELAGVWRACYRFTDRCWFLLHRGEPRGLTIYLQAKHPTESIDLLVAELCNELLDQQVREDLARIAGPLRELITAQAFAEGNLLDPERDDGQLPSDLGLPRLDG